MKLLTALSVMLVAPSALALVDYTEAPQKQYNTQRPQAQKAIQRVQAKPAVKQNNGSSGYFELGTNYESIDLKGQTAGKVNKLNIHGHFQTNFNLFVDVNHWAASTSSASVSNSEGMQQGNPELVVGFNWLRFGKAEEMATIDFTAGLSFAGDSEFATSRTDKIVGVETTKRFYDFALGLGYELNLTGSPDKLEETAIGSIQILKASLGWKVSHDIRFLVDGGSVKISESTEEERVNKLEKGDSFSYISPKVLLGISPFVVLDLGATFRSKTPIDQESLVGAKLWSIPGAYGNSIHAGLNISI